MAETKVQLQRRYDSLVKEYDKCQSDLHSLQQVNEGMLCFNTKETYCIIAIKALTGKPITDSLISFAVKLLTNYAKQYEHHIKIYPDDS